MNRPAPTVYLLYGDDDLAFHEFITQLHERLGDPSTADMNTQRFLAKGLELGAFEEACNPCLLSPQEGSYFLIMLRIYLPTRIGLTDSFQYSNRFLVQLHSFS